MGTGAATGAAAEGCVGGGWMGWNPAVGICAMDPGAVIDVVRETGGGGIGAICGIVGMFIVDDGPMVVPLREGSAGGGAMLKGGREGGGAIPVGGTGAGAMVGGCTTSGLGASLLPLE